jgi:hypothetical protein
MRTDVVLVKLGAVLIVVTAVGNFQTYLSLIMGSPWWVPTALLALLFAVALPVVIAFAFWKFPNTVVGALETETNKKTGQVVTPNELLLIGVSLIGMYTLVFGLIDLVHTETLRATFLRHLRMTNRSESTISLEADAERYAGLARVMIGFVLVASRHKIAGMLHRTNIRHPELEEDNNELR